MTVDDAIEQACADVGIQPPRKAAFGKWLSTDTLAGKKGKGDGRLIVNEHYVTAWNWQTGEKSTVALRDGLSIKEQRAIAHDVAKAKEKAEQDAARAARQASALIAQSRTTTHPYLAAKGFRDELVAVIGAQAVRDIGASYLVAGSNAIIVPARRDGAVTSVQLIWEDGTKKFLFGGEIGGASHRIATGVYTWLCEGFATGLTVRAALRGLKIQATVLCCFSASNIHAVARQVNGRAFVAADHDKPLPQFGGVGTGEHYAKQTGLPFAMPPVIQTDFNDMHQAESIFAVQRILTSVMAGRRAA
ncbi:hypothetical protein [Aquamicrobium zhengzhouense]|uniref:Toprim domain-containing protein n=1 Tax=Aquamicrobium zhengzhouense TaxID=2781738 RepID=A0ABS0SDV9_9HYPH|nr:hypothetical protein [Aquamicrobium zhengzhouense]MBI1621479.1 hypothetical protein [Aquamicrobium zhengzhouense]